MGRVLCGVFGVLALGASLCPALLFFLCRNRCTAGNEATVLFRVPVRVLGIYCYVEQAVQRKGKRKSTNTKRPDRTGAVIVDTIEVVRENEN